MADRAWWKLAFSATLALTIVSAFRNPGPMEWLRQGGEFLGFGGLTLLSALASPRVKWALLIPGLIVAAGLAQLLQFLPVVPGTPAWSDFLFSATGVLLAPLALCIVVVVTAVRYVGTEP